MMTSRENDLYHGTDRHATKIAEFKKSKLREESLFPNIQNMITWSLHLERLGNGERGLIRLCSQFSRINLAPLAWR